jgi:hypothetical protein
MKQMNFSKNFYISLDPTPHSEEGRGKPCTLRPIGIQIQGADRMQIHADSGSRPLGN